ncbi:MAG: universal stress protein [Burkholderiaceae bacterium]|nr:MAG: universal stress protein [Burkholderiaceae bacterium]
MFKHILIPTDGSALSDSAVTRGMRLAREAHARVTALYAMPEYQVLTYDAGMMGDTRELFETQTRARADTILGHVKHIADEEGVPCDLVAVANDRPYDAIIHTARERGCDLILMASHGRRGIEGFLLGSETHKVLTHSKIPVLVHR